MSTIKANTLTVRCGSTLTLGESGKTIAIASGASTSGMGRAGAVDWQTSSIKTSGFTAENGKGYFCDTSSSAFTVTFPASPSGGDIIALADYTRTFQTNALTVDGQSKKIGGVAQDAALSTEGQTATFVFVDDTEGWINVQETSNSVTGQAPFIVACGGNTTVTSGDFKTHIFTAPGTFTVTCAGSAAGSNGVEYMVIGGGGAGGAGCAGGSGGAGGMRLRTVCGSASPINAPAPLQVTTGSFPVSVGAGGSNVTSPNSGSTSQRGNPGSDSVFSSITSTGGGGGGAGNPASPTGNDGVTGGSGGGGGHSGGNGASGNTPPTTPPQGNEGKASVPVNEDAGGGGGGAGAAATLGAPDAQANGGAGTYIPTTFIGPPAPSFGETGPQGRFFAGGGGGSVRSSPANPVKGTGGLGGGGDGTTGTNGTAGSTNMGGGGSGSAKPASSNTSGAGGSGIVMIRYKFQ